MKLRNSTQQRPSRIRRHSLHLEPGPRKATLDAILAYSKAVAVVDAPPVGEIALVLN
ncbi:MAG: hypothetical protein JNM31_00110 [Flavobacteriales bacterium]|nr:hypothetical protein [Flavobacteriales bacterium]